jgi:DNA polymerase-3 subunit gamma/tau
MENFIVSARKYRPKTFDTVIGQQSITLTLKNAIRSNQLAQAFLFCGPRGVGKTTCARILAKTINCSNLSPAIEACEECESCRSFNDSASFNIHELDAASNNSVDDIRNLVDQVRIPPQVGKYKVYIIDEVHMLSQQAFNAFLKTLEEPPPYAKFILATTEKHKIIPTILSRCQIYDFKRIGVEDIARQLSEVALKEGINADPEALHVIAQKADGAMRDALSMFDQIVSFAGNTLSYETVINNLNVLDYEYYFRVVDQMLQGDIHQVLLILNEILDNGFDGQHFLIGLGEHLRNLLVCKDPSTIRLMETSEGIKSRYLKQSEACGVDFLLKSLDINNKCDINYKSSNHKRLHLEIALMQMCALQVARAVKPGSTAVPAQAPPVQTAPVPATVRSQASNASPEVLPEPEPAPKRSKPGTGLSIKDNINPPVAEDVALEDEEIYNGSRLSEPFTQEQLEQAWNEVAAQFAGRFPNLHSTLSRRKPVLKEDFNIELIIDNKVQEDEIRAKKFELVGLLKNRLKNDFIQVYTTISVSQQDVKPYTPMEKFKKLAEKNSGIIRLKDQLGLEIDF